MIVENLFICNEKKIEYTTITLFKYSCHMSCAQTNEETYFDVS